MITYSCLSQEIRAGWASESAQRYYSRPIMQKSGEKLCLQWNDFHDNVSSAFKDLRDDKEFTDVTLACEDGQQVEAHKVVLIASSPFFLNLLKKNKHPHPLVLMRGVQYEDLVSMVDFLYNGEANVYQENLDSFLAMAEELRLKGLERQEDVEQSPEKTSFSQTSQGTNKTKTVYPTLKHKTSTQEPINAIGTIPVTETTKALNSSFDLEELDGKVKSMMTFSENVTSKKLGRARICKECGKEGRMTQIMNHIESHHISNICIPCNICGYTLKTRDSLANHVRQDSFTLSIPYSINVCHCR